MAKGGNSLQAVLNRAKADGDAAPAPAPAIEPVDVSRKAPPSGRQGTKLIGGHFPPEVSTQLRIIADEEGTPDQSQKGRGEGRERGCQVGSHTVAAESLQKKKIQKKN